MLHLPLCFTSYPCSIHAHTYCVVALMPSSSSSQPAPTGAAQRPPETDQNNGDLLQFSHQLLAAMPAGGGEMPMEDLLTALQSAAPQVFVALGHFQQLAQKVCGLNEEMAKKWKEKGNHEYKSGALNDSILSYSHGLLCAELDETMAALLNNRSTAYYEQHRYADACIDADRAQRYQPTYWKAIQRRGRCLEELNFRDLGQKDVQAAAAENREEANDDETMARVLGTAIAGKADTALPPRAVLSHSLKVERSAKGRGLVATERLEPGTMLDETPFAMVARAEALLSVCSYCLQHTTSLYHGEEFRRAGMKSRGFFCSEACATAAWTHYGEVESRNPFFLCCPNDALLAYRIVRGLTLFPQMAELNVCEGFDDVAQHDEVASQVKILEGSFSRELQPQAAVGGFESIMTAIALFMGAVTPAEAELMRKAQRQILLNAKEVTCILRAPSANSRSNDADYVHTNTTGVLGKGLYPIAALLNHSCDPNCFISFAGNPQGSSARLVVRSIRPIMEGEELTVSYGQVDRFHVHSLRQRMLTLRNQYGFPCRCEACRNEVDEPVLAAQKEHYIKAADYYQKGRRLIRERNYETAVTVLLQSYDMVYRYLCPPPNPPQPMVPKTHDALALAYFHLNQRDKCLEHLRAQLATDLEIHHNDNRCSLINDYTRLSYFSTDAAERAKYTEKAVVLLRRFYAPSELLEVYIAMIEHNASHVAE